VWSDVSSPTITEGTAGNAKITSDEFNDHSSSIIREAIKEEPALILVNSYRDIELYENMLVGVNCIFQKRGERSCDFIKRIIATWEECEIFPSAVCLYWSGANFVNMGKTIYHNLIIPRLPRKPFSETGSLGKELQRSVEVFWAIRQGIGRLFRSPGDPDGVVWILDPRFRPESDFIRLFPTSTTWGNVACDGVFDRVLRSKNDGKRTKLSIWSNGAKISTVEAGYTYA